MISDIKNFDPYSISELPVSEKKEGFLAKPEGISIIAIIALFALVICIVLIKRTFCANAIATDKKKNVESGFDNPVME